MQPTKNYESVRELFDLRDKHPHSRCHSRTNSGHYVILHYVFRALNYRAVGIGRVIFRWYVHVTFVVIGLLVVVAAARVCIVSTYW